MRGASRPLRPLLVGGLAVALLACEGETESAGPVEEAERGELDDAPPPLVDGGFDPAALARAPVTVSLQGETLNACPARGTVREEAAVRLAPQPDAPAIDSLAAGTTVAVCDITTSQDWRGIVYPGEGQTWGDCALRSPPSTDEAYDGPCPHGWIDARFVTFAPEASVPEEGE